MCPIFNAFLTKNITLSQYDVYEFIIEGTIYYPTSNNASV